MGKTSLSKEQISNIINLRTKGFSIPEISRMLLVSKSTALKYTKTVSILPEYKQRWLARRNASSIISEKNWKIAQKNSDDLFQELSIKDLKLIGASLYWAEGTKKDLSFINSNPEIIRLFTIILVKAYGVLEDDLKISIRLYEDTQAPESIKFWSSVIGIDLNNRVSINVLKGKKSGRLQYGMCRVRVKKGGLLLKTISAINNRVVSIVSSRSSMDRTSHS